MKKALLFFAIISITSCVEDQSKISTDLLNSESNPRSSFTAIWDICRLTSESNNTFRVYQYYGGGGGFNYLDFTPSCGSAQCYNDQNGNLTSQASINITYSGSSLSFSNCTLNLPSGDYWYAARQLTGTCSSHGFDWDQRNCTSSPMGSIYIKSQVNPDCPPYITNSTCIELTAR